MVSAVDDAFQLIVDKLKAKGMWDNTLLILSTDNGGNLGGSGINYPLRGGKYTFWQGGVRGLGFVAGGLIPAHLSNTTWSGHMHAADWYTTIAALAGADVSQTGPLPPDGVDVSSALLTNATSPRNEVVLQILSNSSGNDYAEPPVWYCDGATPGSDAMERCRPENRTTVGQPTSGLSHVVTNIHTAETVGLECGVLIQGKWKLAWGYPGWKHQKAWDGWIQPPSMQAAPGQCSFETNVSGDVQCKNLDKQPDITSASECKEKCCETKGCSAYQFEGDCFHGNSDDIHCVSPGTTKKHAWIGECNGCHVGPSPGPSPAPAGMPCQEKPCLFDIIADPTEHNDVSASNPEVVETMQKRILELLEGEVTIAASGICPESTGTKSDPAMLAKAEATGFWEPYLTSS